MSIFEFLSQPLSYRIGLTLLHFLWEGALLFLVTWLVRSHD